MAEKERSLLDKVLKPTRTESKDYNTILDNAFKFQRYQEKYGIGEGLKKIQEQKEIIKQKDEAKKGTDGQADVKKTPKVLFARDEFDLGDDKSLNEVGLGESVSSAALSGLIKIPLGFMYLGAEIKDAFAEEGEDVENSAVTKLTNKIEQSILGDILQQSEDRARETATGRITEAIVQIYGAAKFAGKPAAKAISIANKHARKIADKMVSAVNRGKYVSTKSKDLYKASKKVKELNKLSKTDKFVGVTVGGGIGTGAVIMKAEDIGTFGDLFFEPGNITALDRDEKKTSKDEAMRKLLNKFKFGAEIGFPIIPFVVGVGKLGKLAATRGKELVYSNSQIERWIDKYLFEPLRTRSFRTQELQEGIQKLEGTKSAVANLTDDFIRDVDTSLKKISRTGDVVNDALGNPVTATKLLSDLLESGRDVVRGRKIRFEGFNKKVLTSFKESMKKIGVDDKAVSDLITDMIGYRVSMNRIKNQILQGKNLNVGAREFNNILTTRFKNFVGTDYKIFDSSRRGFFTSAFKPTYEVKQAVANIFVRRAREAGNTKYNMDDAMMEVDSILENVRRSKITRAPEFLFTPKSALADSGTQLKNMAENVTGGGRFKPDKKGGLIRTKSDFAAFNKLFGSYKDGRNIIVNTMTDLGEILGRDKFYNSLLAGDKAAKARGEPGMFYKTYAAARSAMPNTSRFKGRDIIESRQGLKLDNPLGDLTYTSPLDGLYTRADFATALREGDKVAQSFLTKSLPYQLLVMIPKGFTQMAKTVLGPFTHARNFFSGAITTLHTGNLLAPIGESVKNLRRSFATIQPQLFSRNLPTNQALYRFLLDEGVVNQNIAYRETMGLIDDVVTSGGNLDRLLNTFSKRFKKLSKIAQDAYTAEDDVWRIFNFAGYFNQLSKNYSNAVNAGIIKKAPTKLAIMREAAGRVRQTIPNYAYVSDAVKASRRSPLGNFVAFPAEIMRTVANTTKQALDDIANPVHQTMGYRTLIGQGLTYTAVPIATYEAARSLYGVLRPEVTAMREMLPEWSADSTIIPIKRDGKYYYVDFSHGFFYDTVSQIPATVISQVDRNEQEPIVTGVAKGIFNAVGQLVDPFISESIYIGTALDIFVRNGTRDDGSRIWNPRDDFGTKVSKSMIEAAYRLSPGSVPQIRRLSKAILGQTLKGQDYEVIDELAGLFGFRVVPINPEKTLNFKIQEFNRDERDERKLIYYGTLSGDPVKDADRVVGQFIDANEKRLETFNKMRKIYLAAMELGVSKKKIREIFEERGAGPLFTSISKNRFRPFTVSDKMKEVYSDLAKEKGIPNPLNRVAQKKINRIIKILGKQRLNTEFRIDKDDFVVPSSFFNTNQPVSQNPTPVAPPKTAQVAPQTGLTQTETALLSPEEQIIRARTRT
jgi:predicted nucleic acid-binding OB-fold protein